MDSKLIKQQISKINQMGELENLSNGQKAVRISLQKQERLFEKSRELRKASLTESFTELNNLIGEKIKIDMNSLSVSGQTVEALVPINKIDGVVKELEGYNIRVDLVSDKQAL